MTDAQLKIIEAQELDSFRDQTKSTICPPVDCEYDARVDNTRSGWFGWAECIRAGQSTGDEVTTQFFVHKKSAVDRLMEMCNKLGWVVEVKE